MGIENRGFASMSKKRHQKVASLGGKTAHKMGKAHKFTSEEAVKWGRKGGLASARKKLQARHRAN